MRSFVCLEVGNGATLKLGNRVFFNNHCSIRCEHHIEMPITKALYEVLYEEKSPALALAELMGRDIKIEVS